jgi:hypothetical protein
MGGHEAPASPVETPPTSVGDATTDPGKRPRRLRPTRVLHRLRPEGKVPSRNPAASAVGHGGFGHRAPWGSPTASVVGGSPPPFFLGRRAAREGTAQAGTSRRGTPTNLFATFFEGPGNRAGWTRRTDGNGKEATDRSDAARLLTRGTLRRVFTARETEGSCPPPQSRWDGHRETRGTPKPAAGRNKPAAQTRSKPPRW